MNCLIISGYHGVPFMKKEKNMKNEIKYYNEKIEDVTGFFLENQTFFDSSALMNESFSAFINKSYLELQAKKAKICVTYATLNLLHALKQSEILETADDARLAVERVLTLAKCGLVELIGHPENRYNEPQQILIAAVKYRANRQVAVVTCNRKLQDDILLQNSLKSFRGKMISALYTTKSGKLYRCGKTELPDTVQPDAAIHEDLSDLFKIA